MAWLSDYVRHLGRSAPGYAVEPRVLVFGHSRGAQLALRFTEIHPETGRCGVGRLGRHVYPAVFDGIPTPARRRSSSRLGWPTWRGLTAGRHLTPRLQSVPIWIGVGGADVNDADVPDAWDPFIGSDD